MDKGFKAQVKNDIEAVFHNMEEHADMTKVKYNGVSYNIPIIIDHEGARDRQKPSSDNADGIFIADLRVYISFYDIKIPPRKETEIIIDDSTYNIIKVGFEAGEIVLDLEDLDE